MPGVLLLLYLRNSPLTPLLLHEGVALTLGQVFALELLHARDAAARVVVRYTGGKTAGNICFKTAKPRAQTLTIAVAQ